MCKMLAVSAKSMLSKAIEQGHDTDKAKAHLADIVSLIDRVAGAIAASK